MILRDKLWDVCREIYREMYIEATPPADFDELVESGEVKEDGFFMNYYLDIERQMEIVNRHIDENNLNSIERSYIKANVYLGCAPNSSYEPKIKKKKDVKGA